MRAALDFILNIFRYHKSKIALFLGLTAVFAVIKFPYGDLTSWLTGQVSQLTQGQVYLTSRDLGLSLLPHPGVKLEGVYVETTQTPPIMAEALTIRPLVLGFPAAVVQAQGMAGGDVGLKFKTQAAGSPEEASDIELRVTDISLAELAKLFTAATTPRGSAQAFLDLVVPRNAPHTMSGSVDLEVSKLAMPTFSATTTMGPVEVPALQLSSVVAEAQIDSGIVQLERLTLGAPGDSLSGQVAGTVTLGARGGQFTLSALDLNLDLTFSQDFLAQPSVDLFIGLIDMNGAERYKQRVSGGVHYSFRISLNQPGTLPRILPPSN